ncbi:hypothetical protein HPK19_03130 [Arthrobacter citreus]|nr:hypothetical protein HPK19_03130 [Arthrobacter citreus]
MKKEKKVNEDEKKYGEIIEGDYGYDEFTGQKIIGKIYGKNFEIDITEQNDPRKVVFSDELYRELAKIMVRDGIRFIDGEYYRVVEDKENK